MDSHTEMGLNTRLAHFGEDVKLEGAIAPPIFQTSLFVFDTFDQFESGIVGNPEGPPYHYSRIGNPTVDLAERKIADLEGTEECKLIGTGMGAITVAIMSCVESGAHVVAVDTCYGPTRTLLSDYLKRFGVKVTFVSGLSADEVIEAITPETTLIYLESPSVFSNPVQFGVDIVIHSGTKFFGGHSDLTAGAVCTTKARMDRLAKEEVNLLGSILAPFPAWLLMRGLRTLGIRMKRHQETGNIVASWMNEQSQVERVFHVGLPNFPQRELFEKQMRGSTSLFSFEPKTQDKERIMRFVEGLELFQLGVSWGGYESLVVPIYGKPDDWLEPRWVIRLFCGLEEPEDLISDLRQSLAASGL
ncbi:MAG: PLP-dependent transferase [Armatimonadetes bacterium]|nr:PLP-dependent transferase [Armatimonadota bacterium]